MKTKEYTVLKDNLLVELISTEDDSVAEFKVAFRKRPLVGKVFIGQIITDFRVIETKYREQLLEKAELAIANMEQLRKNISESEDEEVKKRYEEKLEKAKKEYEEMFPLLQRLSSLQMTKLRAKVKNITLRVTEVVGYDKEVNAYLCVSQPAQVAWGLTKRQRKLVKIKENAF